MTPVQAWEQGYVEVQPEWEWQPQQVRAFKALLQLSKNLRGK